MTTAEKEEVHQIMCLLSMAVLSAWQRDETATVLQMTMAMRRAEQLGFNFQIPRIIQ